MTWYMYVKCAQDIRIFFIFFSANANSTNSTGTSVSVYILFSLLVLLYSSIVILTAKLLNNSNRNMYIWALYFHMLIIIHITTIIIILQFSYQHTTSRMPKSPYFWQHTCNKCGGLIIRENSGQTITWSEIPLGLCVGVFGYVLTYCVLQQLM